MKVVSVRLGHSSTGFTADRYTHVVRGEPRSQRCERNVTAQDQLGQERTRS
jgi:hypothetical protein